MLNTLYCRHYDLLTPQRIIRPRGFIERMET